MHDLINDLATMVSSPYCIRFDKQIPQGSLGRVRHLSYQRNRHSLYNKFDKLYGLEGLRTFLSLPLTGEALWFEDRISDKEVRDLLATTKHLHVLSLTMHRNITKFLTSIGNLIHLRYLNLSGTGIKKLKPSVNLKSLTIKGYGETNFPNWLGDSSFGNIVYMKISSCDNCSWLPPVGQLGCLKELFISKMKSVKSVGAEFYGNGSCSSFQPFPSLEILSFDRMPEWEEWNLIGGTTTEFPTLRRLLLKGCPKLKGNIPTNLPSLNDLWLQECCLLVESEKLDDNNNVIIVKPPSQLMLPSLNSLQQLTLDDFPSLKSFPRDGLPKILISLRISECENLKFFANESLYYSYTSLEKLHIHGSCNSMTSFTLGSLPVLKNLDIYDRKNLRSIVLMAEDVSQQQSLSYLRKIIISHCNELESISICGSGLGFPIPNLKVFFVSQCKKLLSLPKPMNTLIGLQEIVLDNLQKNLHSIAQDGLPISLLRMVVGSVGGVLWNTIVWERLTCLSKLEITSGDIIKAMMKMDATLLSASLVTLKISYLADIECLDGKWLHHLTSLQKLHISHAPKLKLLPGEGLPSSLLRLEFRDCTLLETSLRSKRGKEWRKIAHIPSIVINGKMII